MVSTRSKRVKTFCKLPRFGRVTLNSKFEVEEVAASVSDDENSLNTLDVISKSENSSVTSRASAEDSDASSVVSDDSEDSLYQTPKKTRRLALDDITFSPITTEAKIVPQTNVYEQQRLKRMQENMKALENLGMSATLQTYAKASVHEEAKRKVVNKKRKKQQIRRRALRARAKSSRVNRRTSPRLGKTKEINYNTNVSISNLGFDINAIAGMVSKGFSKENLLKSFNTADSSDEDSDDESDYENLLEEEKKELAFVKSLADRYYTCEEYFTLKKIKPKFIQEHGAFSGWVEDKIKSKIGIANDKESAWEQNGGGKFTFKTPTGVARLKGESAKETARKMLFKNPNSYFYRHTAPGIEHWQGDWTEPENELFLEVAKKYGVGNKWGLFATYIPHRVGYQCSNYYRSHFVEGGIIWDGNFLLDKYGKSIYVGRKNKFL